MSEPQSGQAPYGSPPFRAPPPRKRTAGRTLLWILLAIVVAVVVAVLFSPHGAKTGAGGGGGGRGGGRRPPTVVGVATAQNGDIPILLSALGTVTPTANVTVHTHIAGTLMTVNFREGQMVKEGQLLALVDERPSDIALEQAQGQLLRDQAMLADAKLDLTRFKTLLSQDSIASQQVDTQAALVKQDEGTVKTDEAAVNNAKLNIIYCHITAPVSGRVGLRQVDAGNYVNITDTNGVVIITTLDPIDVEFSLPEDNVPQIAARLAAGAVLTATAYDRAGSTVLAQGTFLTLDNQIDTTTGTVKAKARFHNPAGVLFPSQFVNVQLLVDTKTNQVVIPTQAVRHGSKGDYVFTVDDGTAKMNMVKVGATAGERTAIDSGIKVGDQVITDGGDRLTDGAAILLPGQTPPNFNRKPKASGPLSWIASLFAPKTPADQGGGAAGGSAGGAEASGAGPSGGGGGHGGGAARMQALLDQLNLTADQKAKAAPILADMRQKAAAAGDDPDARRAAMRDGMHALSGILTPEQNAKLADLRAQARAAGGFGGGGGGGGGGAAASAPPAASPSSPQAPLAPASAPPPSASSAPPASRSSGGGGGGDRMARMTAFLGLDADQQAKAQAIFADGPSPEAFAKFRAILRPDQQAKLDARRAQREAQHGGDNQ
jgi:membrane fusion protein, multidrug efflux system